jgi:hypothetical protein
MTVARRGQTWPGVGGRWLPVGSPISLAPLTFNEDERRAESRHCSRPRWPIGSDRGQRAQVRPRGLRRPAHQTAGRHAERARLHEMMAVSAAERAMAYARLAELKARMTVHGCARTRSGPAHPHPQGRQRREDRRDRARAPGVRGVRPDRPGGRRGAKEGAVPLLSAQQRGRRLPGAASPGVRASEEAVIAVVNVRPRDLACQPSGPGLGTPGSGSRKPTATALEEPGSTPG